MDIPDSAITPEHYEAFRRLLADSAGLALGDNKHYLLGSRLSRLARELGVSSAAALLNVVGRDAVVRRKVVEAMMTHETFWFRDGFPCTNLIEHVLPALVDGRSMPLRIWSAACSFGQEPYSISIAIEEARRTSASARVPIEIFATDLSAPAISKAKEGIYDQLAAARGLPAHLRGRYFVEALNGWSIKPEIKARVRFQTFNLLDSYATIGRFDVIFCRNVLIYFSEKVKRDVLARMAATLRPGGFLFLGASESLIHYSDAFETVRCNPGVVYRRRD